MITVDDMAKATAKALHDDNLQEIFKEHPELMMLCMTFAADIANELFGGDKDENVQ